MDEVQLKELCYANCYFLPFYKAKMYLRNNCGGRLYLGSETVSSCLLPRTARKGINWNDLMLCVLVWKPTKMYYWSCSLMSLFDNFFITVHKKFCVRFKALRALSNCQNWPARRTIPVLLGISITFKTIKPDLLVRLVHASACACRGIEHAESLESTKEA